MDGYSNMLPCVYLIRKEKQDWWLRKLNEGQNAVTWTGRPSRAQVFSSRSVCEEYITKYLDNRESIVVDQRILNPYATGFGI